MTSFSRRGALARRSVVATLAIGLTALAQAQSTQWSTGQVTIDFDPSTFSFTSDSTYTGPQGVSPAYSQVGQGVKLDFGGTLAAFASSYVFFGSDARTGSFNALFNFTPEAGYAITGYTVTYTGGYSVESPASVSLNAQSGPLIFNGNGGSDSFSIDNYQSGSVAPLLAGELSASANVEYIQIFDGYELVYSHDEQVLDHCETEDPFTCYYNTVPVYIQQSIYHTESDLGEGQIYLSTISVQAHVVAVPEPGSLALGLAGLVSVAWWARRRPVA
ncbi:PEP-CTERM sorting domain-containing protein [Aquabacterium soli]|jgi:hypothetical protein|nr:PEP-CTERM sorting domain-containing protein [Aquabacterium soli]